MMRVRWYHALLGALLTLAVLSFMVGDVVYRAEHESAYAGER